MMTSRSKPIAAPGFSLTGLVLLAMAIVLNGCGPAPTEAVVPTNTPLEPTVTPGPIFGWPGVIPGESTEEDIRLLLGSPDVEATCPLPGTDLTTGGYLRVPTWYYDFGEEKAPRICGQPCRGMTMIYFVDGVVALIAIEMYEGEPTLDEVLAALGQPELTGETTSPPAHWFTEEQFLEQRGIYWWEMTSLWGYVYPGLGVLVQAGPQKDPELGTFVYYPRGSLPPGNIPVHTMYLFPPMSLEDYCNSMFLFEWMREFCP